MAEYDALTEPGAKGALLRREGLHSTHILDWRLARDHGAPQALETKPPVCKDAKSPAEKEAERLRRENGKLAAELAKTQKALTWEKLRDLTRYRRPVDDVWPVGASPPIRPRRPDRRSIMRHVHQVQASDGRG